jgi:ubiquinone/menaquinone biosynthesis C-methylase UbiE
MPDYATLFESQADRYQALVAHEDTDGNLLKTIESIFPLRKTADVADIGAGTGRVSFLLAPCVRKVYGVEPARGMRAQAEAIKRERGVDNVEFREGGYTSLPIRPASADLVIEGWSLLYFYKLSLPNWRKPIELAFAEMNRVLKPGGTIILIETLGTMRDKPMRFEWSWPLYDHLEKERGYACKTIRTDYRFDSAAQAVDLIGFFFGEETAAEVRCQGRRDVPEWTGVWWQKI